MFISLRIRKALSFLVACLLAYSLLYAWPRDSEVERLWTPNALSDLNLPLIDKNTELFAPPLHTQGRYILDANNQRFKLVSVNWYGASDELWIPGGLDIRHRSDIANLIRRMGFNSVRMPYSDEMVLHNPLIPDEQLAANTDLQGLRSLDIFVASVKSLTDAGLAVIINNHITQATWCCGANPCDAIWKNDYLGPLCRVSQSEEQWLDNWQTVMSHFINNTHVIGADLRNEVRALWGTLTWNDWATVAERGSNMLLGMRSDWLMVIGGTSSGNDLSGALDRPIRLDVPGRVVYSAHVYKWSGWGSREGQYSKRRYPSFAKSMQSNWAYLLETDIAPVWVGEMGAPYEPSQKDSHYWVNLMRFLKHMDADFAYWALNPRKPHGNELETYSLVNDDWMTPIVDYRLMDMIQLMKK
jgi:endoglucanase